MNYDASSLPPSLIPDCEPRLSGPPQSDETLRSFLDSGLHGFWRSSEDEGAPHPESLAVRSSERGSIQGVIKRTCDYAIAASVLLVLWPVLLLIAVLIRLDSKGPVLFRQLRLGLGGRAFWLLKYRTMSVDAEQHLQELEHLNESDGGVLFKMKRDPRVTRFGLFLRKTSLDELPQLFNVLMGQMSLVGPRPLPLRDCDRLETVNCEGFVRRHEVLPGLTGLWQVSGRSRLGAEQMIELDCQYIERWSLWLDLRILARTVGVLLSDWSGSC